MIGEFEIVDECRDISIDKKHVKLRVSFTQ